MKKTDELKRLWREAFKVSPEWCDIYFSLTYRDDEAMTVEERDQVVSALMMHRYVMTFHGSLQGVAYIGGAATRRNQRGNGFMTSLMTDALHEAARRGDMMAALTPAWSHLYYYFEKFGFVKVFYVDAERYTSLHQFATSADLRRADNSDIDRLYEGFHTLEMMQRCRVLHTRRDLTGIMADNALAGGYVSVIEGVNDGHTAAVAFAEEHDGTVRVTDILAESLTARDTALADIRSHYPGLPFAVMAPAGESNRRLTPNGMARMVNVEMCLQAIAEANRDFRCAIRVSDPMLQWNNGTWLIAGGMASRVDNDNRRLDFDVDIETLTAIVFSGKRIGGIIRFPTVRPHLALMPLIGSSA